MEEIEPKTGLTLQIPDFAVVVLIGVSGSGKSTFARKHFLPSECLSSDAFRAMVSDDENDQAATNDAFEALHSLAEVRLRRRKIVVVDATNVQEAARMPLVELARRNDVLAVAIVLNVSERTCRDRNQDRPDRQFGPHVVSNQSRQLRQSLPHLRREGFRYVFKLNEPDIADVRIERIPLWTDRRQEAGPFDIVGDIHGCYEELVTLLARLGYGEQDATWKHPEGRRAVFVGDLVDRGPKVVETVRLVRSMMKAGSALCVPGNHDMKLSRALKGNPVSKTHGLLQSLEQVEALPEEERKTFTEDYLRFTDDLVSHMWLDGGALCVAHAGMKESYIGRASGRVRDFALYGETTGETDEFGLPVRYPWAEDYRGKTSVVYGHTPVPEAEWLNNTLNLDTGCVFGGKLTALRWPERELMAVPAARTYAEPVKPFLPVAPDPLDPNETPELSLQWQHDELLRAEDVLGKRIVTTRLTPNVIVPAENAAAALEVMSRFAAEPRWLLYLPPTMSPCETAPSGDLLERPAEAFAYFRAVGVTDVVCQRKHMGSRAVIVICKNAEAARQRFGATTGEIGQCVTRTGRRFFDDPALHQGLLAEFGAALERAGFWEEFETDWACFDCELMPWNAKAQGLLREQYAPVGAAAETSLTAAIAVLEAAAARGQDVTERLAHLRQRLDNVTRYRAAYAHYCWDVQGLEGIKIAPFHLLATEGKTYFDRDHVWHITTLAKLAEQSTMLFATDYLLVNTEDAESVAAGTRWWEEMTATGGEGMVVKPREFIVRGPKGLVQPAVKVRGREYLRIIYGPEYTDPENIERLRKRGLGAKRSLALREFALGVEGLERFVRKEPLRRVHECAFAVLALESEPIDPRL